MIKIKTKDLTQFNDNMIISTKGTQNICYLLSKVKSPILADVLTIDFVRFKFFTTLDKDFSKSEAEYFTEVSRKYIFDKLIRRAGG